MTDAEVFALLCWRRMVSDMRLGHRLGKRGTPNNWHCPLRVKACPQREECWALMCNWLGRTTMVLYDQQV